MQPALAQPSRACPLCLAGDDASGYSAALRSADLVDRNSSDLLPAQLAAHHAAKGAGDHNAPGNLVEEFTDGCGELRMMASSLKKRPVSLLQNYVIRRLGRHQGLAWLDTQALDAAIRAAEMLGTLAEFGSGGHLDDQSETERDVASISAVRITASGQVRMLSSSA